MKIAVAGGTGTVGRHVVDVSTERGHSVVVLSRSSGIDLVTGAGLASAIDGVDTLIDVTSVQTRSSAASKEFFGTVTANLLAAEVEAGVAHHVLLGIVGSQLAPHGYYAGKIVQEDLVEHGPVSWSILRATQFHEFATQIYGQITAGPLILVPKMVSQPVAAREVAARLVDLASAGPAGRVPDLAGPRVEKMIDMVRGYAAAIDAHRPILQIPVPGAFGKAMRDGTLLPTPGAVLGHQTYAEWLAAGPARTA